jgi:serine/threonine protein phosphatase 1
VGGVSAVGTYRFDRSVAVIGDIHGSARQLRSLLQQLGDLPIVVVGDLCDHGPDTPDVLELLIERGAIGVRGNHDEWFVRWARGTAFYRAVLQMGADATLRSYGVETDRPRQIMLERHRVPEHHVSFVERLHVALDLTVLGTHYWVTHAGIPRFEDHPAAPREDFVRWLAEHVPDMLVWGWNAPSPLEMPALDRTLVMGHVSLDEPIDTPSLVAVNTGAGDPGGKLTAVILPERRFVTVSS